MSIQARYAGTCPECGGRWEPGDPIRPVVGDDGYLLRREAIEARRAQGLNLWQHAVCPDTPDDLTVRHGICQTCWLDHPEGACDR